MNSRIKVAKAAHIMTICKSSATETQKSDKEWPSLRVKRVELCGFMAESMKKHRTIVSHNF